MFACFVDADRYTRWLGVPLTIHDRHFAADLEWGNPGARLLRGRRPGPGVMRWDFDDQSVPVSGRALVGYLRLHPRPGGTRVEVHQAPRPAPIDAAARTAADADHIIRGDRPVRAARSATLFGPSGPELAFKPGSGSS